MTGTSVKEVRDLFSQLTANAPKGARSAAAGGVSDGGFQSVWNDRMSKGAEKAPAQTQSSARPEKSVSEAESADESKTLRTGETEAPPESEAVSGEKTAPEEAEAVSPEELERAMEVLGAAALELMRQIADIFGISMEELQAAMEGLELRPLELLEPKELGKLLLSLGGAEDISALVTDETLYENYRSVMQELDTVLGRAAEELETQPDRMPKLLESAAAAQEPEISAEAVPEKPEAVKHYENFEGSRSVQESVPAESAVKAEDETSGETDGKAGQETPDRGEAKQPQRAENPFVQEVRTLQPGQELGQTQAAPGSAWSPDTQDIMRQIMDYMRFTLNSETTDLQMQLHPASLGTLQVQVQSKAGVITASFITQNEAVKAALESQMVQLKESFELQGVKVEAIEVTVQSHAFERNLDQGRGQNQGGREPERKPRVRRINLNDSLAMESMEEEDELIADMMAAEGSTVDYTA